MATFNSFEEIEAWKEGRSLVLKIREICKRETVKRDFSFVDQITRSVRSVPANIAEGFESNSPADFVKFLGYAKRSAGEVRSHLYDGLDEGYLSSEEFDDLAEQTKRICRMIAKLIHYLQSLDQKQKRTFEYLTVADQPKTKNQ